MWGHFTPRVGSHNRAVVLLSSLSRGAKRAVVLPSNLGRGVKRAVGSLQVAQGETPTPIFKLERAVVNDSFDSKAK